MKKVSQEIKVGDVVQSGDETWVVMVIMPSPILPVYMAGGMRMTLMSLDRDDVWTQSDYLPDYPVAVIGEVDFHNWKKSWEPGRICP